MTWKEYQSRRPNEGKVEAWIKDFPGCNWGVVTGSISGVIVLDVDGEAGARSLKECGDLPVTWETTTGRGVHLWFRHPGGDIPSAVGVRPGLDVRAEGGYVVGPESIHESGQFYAWKHAPWDTRLADAPSSVLDLVRTPSNSKLPVTTHPPNDSRIITEGSRNDSLYRIGRQMHAIGLGNDAIQAALNIHNQAVCRPPMDTKEVERIACQAATQPDRSDFVVNNSFLPPKGGGGKETNFAPMPVKILFAQEPDPTIWIWEFMLPRGRLVILSAYMKVGKTTFVYHLVEHIVKGKPFLGFTTTPTGVLILALEEHVQDVRCRLEELGVDAEDSIYVHCGPLNPGDATIQALGGYIKEYDIGLIVVDTLSHYWRIDDENNNAEVVKRCSPLLALAHQADCCVLLIHHDNKTGGTGGRSIRGGGALLALVDQALMLESHPKGGDRQRVLRTLGRFSESPKDLVIELQDGAYVNLGSLDDFNPLAYQRTLLTELNETPKCVDELVSVTGLSGKIVRKTLGELGESVEISGAGKKGDPYRYRQHSFPSQPLSIGEETNSTPKQAPKSDQAAPPDSPRQMMDGTT